MKRMNSNRETARIVGVLYLILIFASIAGFFLIEAGLSAPDFLSDVDATKTQVASGVSLELINGIAVIGVAVLMFPLLRKENEALALGYLAFRIMEVVIVVAAIISPLALIAVGQEYAKAGAPDASMTCPPITDPGCKSGSVRKGGRTHAQKAIFLRANHPEAEGGGSAAQSGSNGTTSL